MDRSAEFEDGFAQVREPKFQTVQAQHNANYRATSVLDNVIPNQNGLGSSDLQRRLVGSQGAATGRSQETFDRQLWLRHPEPSNRARTIGD